MFSRTQKNIRNLMKHTERLLRGDMLYIKKSYAMDLPSFKFFTKQHVPSFSFPKITLPKCSVPVLRIPSFTLPRLKLPSFNLPKFSLPKSPSFHLSFPWRWRSNIYKFSQKAGFQIAPAPDTDQAEDDTQQKDTKKLLTFT